jgi:hypothetical protein
LNINLIKAKAKLEQAGIIYKDSETLKSIAEHNATTPNEIYKIISVKEIKASASGAPSALGRKTLGDLARIKKLVLHDVLAKLKDRGLTDIDANSKVKQIADDLGISPVDVYNLLIATP